MRESLDVLISSAHPVYRSPTTFNSLKPPLLLPQSKAYETVVIFSPQHPIYIVFRLICFPMYSFRPLFFQRCLSSVGWSSGSHKVCSDSQDSVIDGGHSGILASGSGKGCWVSQASEDYDGYVYHKDDWNRVSSMALDGGTVETLGLKLFVSFYPWVWSLGSFGFWWW